MDEQAKRRRKLIATLTVVLPVLAGLVIAALAHFLGNEEIEIGRPTTQRQPHLVEAATPAAAGSPAPRVRLTEGGSGRSFDGASLGSEPYAVLFISTRCAALGDFLRRVAAELEPGEAAVLAISAAPRLDSPGAVGAWLFHHHLRPGGPVRFLIGDADELRGYWNAWGFDGPASECLASVPAHLVSGADKNAGVVDVTAASPASLLTGPLRSIAR